MKNIIILLLFILLSTNVLFAQSNNNTHIISRTELPYIAYEIADKIESLKNKYPHLANFSTEKNLKFNIRNEGYLPGSKENPTFISVHYSNGILDRIFKKGKRSAEIVFDQKTGVEIYIHLFNGDSRGSDLRIPQKIGDLSIHLYVQGPTSKEIKEDIQKTVTSLQNEFKK